MATGDVEDAPALDPLGSFSVEEKDGAVYITGEKSHIENKRRTLDIKCKASGQDQVVVVGGYVYFSLRTRARSNSYPVALAVLARSRLYVAQASKAPLPSFPPKERSPMTAPRYPKPFWPT